MCSKSNKKCFRSQFVKNRTKLYAKGIKSSWMKIAPNWTENSEKRAKIAELLKNPCFVFLLLFMAMCGLARLIMFYVFSRDNRSKFNRYCFMNDSQFVAFKYGLGKQKHFMILQKSMQFAVKKRLNQMVLIYIQEKNSNWTKKVYGDA